MALKRHMAYNKCMHTIRRMQQSNELIIAVLLEYSSYSV